jgi:hypothetical protein
MRKSNKIYVDTGNLVGSLKANYLIISYLGCNKSATLLSVFRQKRAQKTSQSLRQGGLKFKYEKKRLY